MSDGSRVAWLEVTFPRAVALVYVVIDVLTGSDHFRPAEAPRRVPSSVFRR